MNPGVPEEAGKTARSIIDVFKEQPHVFGLLLINIALLVFMFYALHQAATFREKMVDQVFENTKNIGEVLQQRGIPCPK
jgi:lactate dehydrogenase-like 2-hydroxyacid dehydrogenase